MSLIYWILWVLELHQISPNRFLKLTWESGFFLKIMNFRFMGHFCPLEMEHNHTGSHWILYLHKCNFIWECELGKAHQSWYLSLNPSLFFQTCDYLSSQQHPVIHYFSPGMNNHDPESFEVLGESPVMSQASWQCFASESSPVNAKIKTFSYSLFIHCCYLLQ